MDFFAKHDFDENNIMNRTYFFVRKLQLFLLLSLCTLTNIKAQELKDSISFTLPQVLDIALNENPTIKIANKEISLKKEAKKEAYAGLFPELSLTGSYSRAIKKQTMVMAFGGEPTTIKVGSDNTYNGGLVISLPVFAPALYQSINLTQSDVDLAVEKARSSKLGLINQVTKAFYQLLLTQDSYEVLEKSYLQAQANFDVVNAKFQHGSVSEYDKIRADVQVRSLKPTLVSARNGVNLARMQLKVLMGIDSNWNIAVQGNLEDYEMIMFRQQLSSDSLNLQNNTDLKQLDLNAKLLENTQKLQRTNFLPTLGASFNYLYMSMNNDFKISHYDWYPYSTLGLNLTIPLFKASNFTKLNQTKIQMIQLKYNKVNLKRQISMQVESYLDNMRASTEQVLSNKENVAQALKGREIARKRYEVGKGTILELNDAEVALTQAQLTYNQSIYDYLTAKADLDKLLGGE